jgi:polyisoprenoid-binding protein YceI
MTTTISPVANEIPGYLAGTWTIDPSHSEVGFTVRHLMVSKVRGRFSGFEGQIVTAEDPLASSLQATVNLASIDTDNADRDAHIRSADFFEVERYPTMTYESTGVRRDGDHLVVDGELSLHGVTRPVPLHLEVNGFQANTPFGDTRVGFSASGELNRSDFGIAFNLPIDGGGVVVGEKVQLNIEVEAILQPPRA